MGNVEQVLSYSFLHCLKRSNYEVVCSALSWLVTEYEDNAVRMWE